MPEPPPFASQSYWETRFEKDPNTFDWLQPATALDGPLRNAIEACPHKKPQILHIGCGTSDLSFHLRRQVEDPRQIHNLDFSVRAIELGRQRERELFPDAPTQQGSEPDGPSMRWTTADLLSPSSSLLAACREDKYDIILDKGTSDALACGEDVLVRLPYNPFSPTRPPEETVSSPTPDILEDEGHAPIHPVDVLALHLAALARPGAHWIALSYSASRFPFLDPFARPEYPPGVPDPALYWRLAGREAVEAEAAAGCARDDGVFRPRVTHELYVLVRTEREV